MKNSKKAVDKIIEDNKHHLEGCESSDLTDKLVAIIKNQSETIKDLEEELSERRAYDYRCYAPPVWQYPGYPGGL
jgi:gas vesicle protein